MERPLTVAGLLEKRAELVKLQGQLEAELCKLTADIDHLDGMTNNAIWHRKKNVRHFFEADTEVAPRDGPTVIPGKQVTFDIPCELEITPLNYAPGSELAAKYEVMAIGVIEYESPGGNRYVVGFSRLYDADSNRFRVLNPDDPEADREYED